MQTIKPFLISLAILALGYASVASAAPYFSQEASIVPKDSTENVGTSTNRWNEGWFNSMNVTSFVLSSLVSGNLNVNGCGLFGTTSTTTICGNGANSWFQGNVGIGTTGPGANLDIQRVAGDSLDILRVGSTQYYFGFARNNSTGALSIQGSQVGNNNIVLAPTSGNVGIGTTTPTFKLDVAGTGYISSSLFVGGAITATSTLNVTGLATFGNASTTQIGSTGSSYFATNSGNVGIGTTSPVSKLSVVGESAFAGGGVFGLAYAGTAAPANGLIIQGNVGIGTTSPAFKLDVAGTGYISSSLFVGGAITATSTLNVTGLATFGNASTTQIGSTGNAYFATTNGNVGIGTTAPGAPLHVYSTTADTSKQLSKFEYLPSGGLGNGYISVVAGSGSFDIDQNSGGGGTTRYGTYVDTNLINNYAASGGAFGNINFVTGNVGGSGIAMTIGGGTQKGNVGIGTTTPASLLHVKGGVAGTGGWNHTALLEATYPVLMFKSDASGKYAGIGYDDTSSWNFRVGMTSNDFTGSGLNAMSIGATTGSVSIGSDALYVVNGGNVGIGTTEPGLRLDVWGVQGAPATSGTAQTGILRMANPSGSNVLDFGAYGGPSNALWIQSTDRTGLGATYPLALQPNGGNVGIGTTGPGSKLDVRGTTDGVLANFVQSATTAGTNYAVFAEADGTNTGTNIGGHFLVGNGTNNRAVSIGALAAGANNYAIYSPALAQSYIQGNVGIGTTTPVNKLDIAGGLGFFGTIPTLSSCGTSPAITKGSTDSAGKVTQGTISTGCVITFAAAKTNAPFCTVTDMAGLTFSYTVSTSAITVTNIGALSSTDMAYSCTQNNN